MKMILSAILISLILVEYFFRTPFLQYVKNLNRVALKSLHIVVSKKISDHWKELILLRFARDILIYAGALGLMLAGLTLFAWLLFFLLDYFLQLDATVVEFYSKPIILLVMLISSVMYVTIRGKIFRV